MSDALRLAFQMRTRDCPRSGIGCPSGEAIAAAMRGAGCDDTFDALANCARCAAIAQIEAGLGHRPRAAPWPLALAASTVLAIGAAALVATLRPPPADDVLRGALGAIEPAVGSELDTAPAEFRWRVDAAAICRVDVRSSAGDPVWRSGGVRGGRVAVDAALPSGAYLWTVHCAADEIGPFHFRIR